MSQTVSCGAIHLQRIGVTPVPAKPAEKKAFTFRGRIESVNLPARTLTVIGENVDGWMAAMTRAPASRRGRGKRQIDAVHYGPHDAGTENDSVIFTVFP